MPFTSYGTLMLTRTNQTTGEEFVFFWGQASCFSNWFAADYEVDSVDYNCGEQRMMHAKALLFNDEAVAQQIMRTPGPWNQKKLGRAVKNFDPEMWDAHKMAIMEELLMAKFSQNAPLLDILLATGTKTIVEASPTDLIWGIGLREDDPRITDRSAWRGQNLLGQALMNVRQKLALLQSPPLRAAQKKL